MGKPGATGFTRVWNAFFYSMQGFRSAWRHEAAFRQEAVLAIVLLPAAFWLGDNAVDYALLIGCLFIVLITELLNSAIEANVDRTGMEHHKLSGRAKDMASAAVFCSLLLTVVVWGMLAWEKFA